MFRIILLSAAAVAAVLVATVNGNVIKITQNAACVISPQTLGKPLELSGSEGEIVSYNYGQGNYANNLRCAWTVEAPEDTVIQLEFIDFDVEGYGGSSCSYDYLNVYDGDSTSSPRIAHLCGDSLPGKVRSSGNIMYLTFTTDNSVTERGFKIKWSSDHASAFTVPPYTGECGKPQIEHATCDTCYPDGRVVGGQEATPGSWPWQVEIKLTSSGHYCGGSLIHPQWVLTAAHCMSYSESRYTFHVGKHNKYSTDPTEQIMRATRIYVHSGYNSQSLDNDVALVQLTEPVELGERVDVVCMPDQGYVAPDGLPCYTTGWGSTAGTGNDNVLKQALVPIVGTQKCLEGYPGGILDTMVCAGYFNNGGHDACQGDSGGPLHCQNADGIWEVIGITSWGYGCARPGYPGVYSRVASFPSWIDRVMNGGNP